VKDLDWAEGLRGAVGLSIPAAIGLLVNHLAWGILCAFATLWILSCDVGGAYRQKAVALAGAGVAVLAAYIFAWWMVQSTANYIIGTFLWVFFAALIGVGGNAAAQAGLVTSTVVVTSVVLFVSSEFGIRLLVCLIGVCWALLLSLALWPLRPYSPLFQALSASFAKLADLARAFWSGAPTRERSATNLQFAVAYDDFISSLERPRSMWGAVRARRAGPTLRSMQLLALIEQLDDVARTLVTLREIINLVGKEKWFDGVRQSYEHLTDLLPQLVREMAAAVAVRGRAIDPSVLRDAFQKFKSAMAAKQQEHSVNLSQQKELERTTEHLIEQVSDLAETVSGLKSGDPRFRVPPEARFGPRPKTFDPVAEIRNNLSFRSSSFRHALRLGLAASLASLLASTVHVVRGYWIPMTVVLVLKPNFGGTLERSVQRITGTILGALIAAVLLLVLRDPWLLLVALAPLAFASFALRNRNYGLFALAITATIMLMLDLAHPVTVWDSFLRILHTVIGSLLALVSGYLLFPVWESRRLPLHIAEALRGEAAFLRALRDALHGQGERPVSEFRRDAAVAVSNAVTAGQRLLSEPPHRRGDVEAAAAAINDCRRILHALAAISDYPTREFIRLESGDLNSVIDTLAEALDDVAANLQSGTTLRRLPHLTEFVESLENALHGIPEQMPVMAGSTPENARNDEIRVWLFYHLKNVGNLTLALREVSSRLLQSMPD
jgi:uncharacterized membrane protein YccC